MYTIKAEISTKRASAFKTKRTDFEQYAQTISKNFINRGT